MPESRPKRDCFPDTPWSTVRRAAVGGSLESSIALARLCEAYWYPLYHYLRRSGHSRDAAGDLVQGFFARFLESDSLPSVDPAEGRFRSYLLGALKHYAADEKDRWSARKRGTRRLVPLDLDLEDGERRYAVDPSGETDPEQAYERKWAMALLGRALGRLRLQYEQAGQAELFRHLSSFLPGARETPSYSTAAERTGLSLAAVRVAIHRLRSRYRVALHREVARTVSDAADVDREVRYLIEILGR